MIVIPGPASVKLGTRIATELGTQPFYVDHRLFPDGESYIRVDAPVEGRKVVIIQTTAPEPDRKLIQLFLLAKTVRDLGADEIIAVVPYLAYSRQDKQFLGGESLSLDLILRFLEAVGVKSLVVFDVHNSDSIMSLASQLKLIIHNVSSIPVLAEYLKKNGFKGAYSLSPDKGAVQLAEAGSEILGGRYGYFEKTRDRKTGKIEMKAKNLDVSGINAVVFDDIISSGGTTSMAVASLKSLGAGRVAAACTHALFMSGAEEKIRDAGADLIVASDSVESPFSKVSVSRITAQLLRKL